MCKYSEGDVVYALVMFGDRQGAKPRPCVVLSVDTDCKYLLAECYSLLEKHSNLASHNVIKTIKEGTQEFFECGFTNDTVVTKSRIRLSERFLKAPEGKTNPIGFCSFLALIKNVLGLS